MKGCGFFLFLSVVLLGVAAFASLHMRTSQAVSAGSSALFTDVERGSYYDDSLLDMVRKGIIKGYDDGRFGPHDYVTRAQAAVMLGRYHHNVVMPLQEKVKFILEHLKLGRCGDGAVDAGEECDDGNTEDGDGCSGECLEEKKLPVLPPTNGYRCVPCGDECLLLEPGHYSRCMSEGGFTCTYAGGTCRRMPAIACTMEAKRCPDGSFVSRNPALDCAFDSCPAISMCGNGVCEEGEADTVEPGGCGPSADPRCLGPPARFQPGTCPKDCG